MTEKVNMLVEDTETIWNYSKYHIGEWVEMYTTDKVMMKRYDSFASKYPDSCKVVKEDKYSMTFSIDPKCMGFYPRKKLSRTYTEEQKKVMRERLEAIRTKS